MPGGANVDPEPNVSVCSYLLYTLRL